MNKSFPNAAPQAEAPDAVQIPVQGERPGPVGAAPVRADKQRDAGPNMNSYISIEEAEVFAQAEVEDFRQRVVGTCEEIARRRELSAKEYITECPSKASLNSGANALKAAAFQIKEKPHNVCYSSYKPRPAGNKTVPDSNSRKDG